MEHRSKFSNCDSQSGFTLVELLVCLSIVLLLASIAIPILADHRARARDVNRLALQHNVRVALEGYYVDNLRYPDNPTPGTACSPIPGQAPYHADCLIEIRDFIPKETFSEGLGRSKSIREEWFRYYDYTPFEFLDPNPGAVVKVQLEKLSVNNSCSIIVGSWCYEVNSNMESAHCLCTGAEGS